MFFRRSPTDPTGQLAAARDRMLTEHLRGRGIEDERVLTAMQRVPRERFLAAEQQADAYADCALPIACEQTISQPFVVAAMSEALALTGTQRVLEVGTGSGYQTAVLAELSAAVYSIERHGELAAHAATLLGELGYTNIDFRVGDGAAGWPDAAPFDAAIITAATDCVPTRIWSQLRDGGRLVVPLGDRQSQTLYLIRKLAGQEERTPLFPCRFVPLISEAG